jgi:Cu(I)/Ag(I) efflux system membrane fusion protein
VVLGNADGALKPGMYGAVTVRGDALHDATRVPTEAVIRTGTRNVVIVAESAGRYRPVAVVPGPERDGEMVVTGGLKPGQHVVVSGQFLIDSEASLQGAYHRMDAASAADATPGQRLDPKPDPGPDPDHAAGHGDDRDAGRAP